MLELAVLGLLKERPMHGYQLSRELGDSLRRTLTRFGHERRAEL